MITVKTVYSQDVLVAIIKQHYTKPFDINLISLGDLQMFAEQYTNLLLFESRSGPALGKLAHILVNKLMSGILAIDLPDPPLDGVIEWGETEW